MMRALARPAIAHSRLFSSAACRLRCGASPVAAAKCIARKPQFSQTTFSSRTLVTCAVASGRHVGAARSEARGQIRVQHILLNPDEEETAEQLNVALQGGESFEELAKKHSRCPTATSGGDIGWVVKGQLARQNPGYSAHRSLVPDPAFEAAAFSLPVGGADVASVKTRFGVHLVRVLSERPAPPPVHEMSVEELTVRLAEGSKDLQLMDVREQHEWDICKLPGFELYPTSLFREWAPTLVGSLDPARETIVLCHHGVRSQNVAEWLVRQGGFVNVHNVTGGIDMFARTVGKGMPRY